MVFMIRKIFIILLTLTMLIGYGDEALCQDGFQVNAKAAVLFEFNSAQFLLEQNADEKIEPASFTKVMTLYLAQDGLKKGAITLDDPVTVSENAWRTGGSQMFIEVGKQVRLEDLLNGIAVVSGNDACVALAEHMSGKEEAFVEQMNQKAKELELVNTIFKNPHGLPADGQYTSARDMALLAYHYIKEYPQVITLHSKQTFTFNNITQANRNGLLRMNVGVDGLKTGYIENGGYHLIATVQREGRRLIAVVMGAKAWKERENEALNLLNYGFRNFLLKEPVKKGEVVKTVPVKGGKYDAVELIAQEGVVLSVSLNGKDSLKVVEDIPSQIVAPVKKGEILGKVTVEAGGKQFRQVNLLAKNEVPKGWQAYWRFGIAVLGIIVVVFLMQRILRRRKPTKGLH